MGGLKLKWEVPNLHKNQSIIPDCLKCFILLKMEV